MTVKISIHQRLLDTLRQRAAGLPVGSRFPTEHELCAEFGVSRATINKVMVKLTEDGLITRTRRKGSFVMKPDKPQVPITFLLPCADFISDAVSLLHSQHTREMLKGVSQVAFEHNWRVQTVPVSPTNYRHDIDWKQLDFINSDSKVLVDDYWYCDLFPLFKERGCKVAFVEHQTYHFKQYADYLANWFVLSVDRVSAMDSAVKLLADRGCRRIALAHSKIGEKDHPVLHGYKSGLKKCGLRYSAWMDTLDITNETIAAVIAEFYRKNKFDALLLDPRLVFKLRTQRSLNYYLDLPENVKIMAVDEISYNQRAFPTLSSVEFPYEEMGRIAAQHLLEDEFKPGWQSFNAKIIERESTMQETEQSALTG
jgi:DNA-binding LacI/PurR family transcriptional regulator